MARGVSRCVWAWALAALLGLTAVRAGSSPNYIKMRTVMNGSECIKCMGGAVGGRGAPWRLGGAVGSARAAGNALPSGRSMRGAVPRGLHAGLRSTDALPARN